MKFLGKTVNVFANAIGGLAGGMMIFFGVEVVKQVSNNIIDVLSNKR